MTAASSGSPFGSDSPMSWIFDRAIRGRALQSRVARRVAVLFVGCAIAPLLALAAITLNHTTRELESRARERLRYDAKSAALEAFGRLQLATESLRLVGAAMLNGDETADDVAARLEPMFGSRPDGLVFRPLDGRAVTLAGTIGFPELSLRQREHLERVGALLWVDDGGTSDHDLLVTRIESRGRTAHVAATVDYRRLFGLDEWDVLPPGAELCVFRDSRQAVCSPNVESGVAERIRAAGADASLTVDTRQARLFVQTWALPLQPSYGAANWVVAMMRPQALVLAPLSSFRWNFWVVTALSLLVVTWLTLTQVRRQLEPLTALIDATRHLAQREFDHRVEIVSDDEFHELGIAFNSLSMELQRQFGELEALTLGTLETLGRTIDAKSPWTAGHSSRVTALAVAIAEEMGLEASVVADIRRGGLVHDIGKLAIPSEILDKPGRLTPEEEAIMQRHAPHGVHILKPIGAFERLLPIVGQHHERWDGQGYPDGLAGARIALTARVLAVADVYDALISDRPYRRGLPVDNVVETISDNAGHHFDPDVVRAFARVMSGGWHREHASAHVAIWNTPAAVAVGHDTRRAG